MPYVPVQLVIDTSAVLAVILEEPERPALIAAARGAVLLAPASVPWEVGNALVSFVRRRRLTRTEAGLAWTAYEAIPRRLVEVDVGEAIQLAIESGLYAYDAYFLVLARQRRLPLLTLDRRLGAGARRTGVELVEVQR
jgi:predicted nucleic acid-binding protein